MQYCEKAVGQIKGIYQNSPFKKNAKENKH